MSKRVYLCRGETVESETQAKVTVVQCAWDISGQRLLFSDSLGRFHVRDVSTNARQWYYVRSINTQWLCFGQVPSQPNRIVWLFSDGPCCLHVWSARIASKAEWSLNFPVCSIEQEKCIFNGNAIADLSGLSCSSDIKPTVMSIAQNNSRNPDHAVIGLSSGLICICRLTGSNRGVICAWKMNDCAMCLQMFAHFIIATDSTHQCSLWKIDDLNYTDDINVELNSKYQCHVFVTDLLMSKDGYLWMGYSDGSISVHCIPQLNLMNQIELKSKSAIVSLSMMSDHTGLLAVGQKDGSVTLIDCSLVNDLIIVSRQRQVKSGAVINASYQPLHCQYFVVIRENDEHIQLWTAPLSKENRSTHCSSLILWPHSSVSDCSKPSSVSTHPISNGQTVESYRPGLLSAALSAQVTAVSSRKWKPQSKKIREKQAKQALQKSGELSHILNLDHSENKYDYSEMTQITHDQDLEWKLPMKHHELSEVKPQSKDQSEKMESDIQALIKRNSEEIQHRCAQSTHCLSLSKSSNDFLTMRTEYRLRDRMFRI